MANNISIIITAYNEAPRIGAVLDIVAKMPWEVIVVDDGSTDRTSDVVVEQSANQYKQLHTPGVRTSYTPGVRAVSNCVHQRVKLIRHKENLGKGAAMSTGLKTAKGNIIIFLDADLVGLKKLHLESLVRPMANKNYDMVLGYLGKDQKKATNLASRMIKSITGIRAVKKEMIKGLDFTKMGYGVDRFITNSVKASGGKIKKLELPGLTQIRKEEKIGYARGLKHRAKMYKEILIKRQ